jgi:hypothetical protein
MLGFFSVDRPGLLQLVSDPWYGFWEEFKKRGNDVY